MTFTKIALALVLSACSCVTVQRQEAVLADIQAMQASTVQIVATISLTAIVDGEEYPSEPAVWSGSGVIYKNVGGISSEMHSMVLTANHVLEVPKPGYIERNMFGAVRVDAVTFSVVSADKRTCGLSTLVMGESTVKDVAIGEADCFLGPAVKIANKIPPMGAKLYTVGHPLGIPNTMVTEGFFSGWLDGFMVSSTPITHGNSGGGVFYNNEIVGLAVRGTDYPNMALIAPLSEILERIEQADILKL